MTVSLKIGQSVTLELPAGQKLTITAGASSTVGIVRYTGSTETANVTLTDSESVVLGEYFIAQNVLITCLEGSVSYELSQSTENVRTGESVSLTGGVTITTGEGAPDDAVQATLSRNPTGDDNALTFTAVEYGARGNQITIAYIDPDSDLVPLSVAVSGQDIVVTLETDAEDAIVSTAADVLAAIEAHPVASTMVTVAINAADSGGSDDGSGVVTALAAAPMTGGAGTGIGTDGPGSRYTDRTTGNEYKNTGTMAVPVWAEQVTAALIPTYIITNAGAPDDAVQATLAVNPTGDENGLTFTAIAYGAVGNAITIEYVDPEGNDQELAVTVTGTAIVVSLATDSEGAITSTAALVLAAIEADEDADALVTVAIDAGDSGESDDGSGVVTAMAEDALEGGEGTGIGAVVKGALCIDTTNGLVYRNSGTQAVPVWTLLADD